MRFIKRAKEQSTRGSRAPSPELPERAPELFRGVLADRWAPALRDLGFQGSGRIFVLPDERDWVMLGFQSSKASNAEWVKFTINLLVVGKQAWHDARERTPRLPAKPSPNTIGPHRYVQRIDHLTYGGDHWWRLYAAQDSKPVIAEVLAMLSDVAVPKLRQEMSNQSQALAGRSSASVKNALERSPSRHPKRPHVRDPRRQQTSARRDGPRMR